MLYNIMVNQCWRSVDGCFSQHSDLTVADTGPMSLFAVDVILAAVPIRAIAELALMESSSDVDNKSV